MITKESVGSWIWKGLLGERVLTMKKFEVVMAHVGEVIPLLFNDEFGSLIPKCSESRSANEPAGEAGYLDMMKAVYTC